MANMEFCQPNYLNTTTMISVTSGTTSAGGLFERKNSTWSSNGDNSDLTTSTIRIGLNSPTVIDRLILTDINLKEFKIYYDSVSTNYFSLTSGDTLTTNWTGNSTTDLYLKLAASKTVSVVTIEATKTIVANAEKAIGEFWITKNVLSFEVNPPANGYKVKSNRKEFVHELSDGGTTTYIIQDNFEAKISRSAVSTAEHTALKTLYELYTPFAFIPFPTTSGWDTKIYEVNWIGDFDFDNYYDNYTGNGYEGTMQIKETPR